MKIEQNLTLIKSLASDMEKYHKQYQKILNNEANNDRIAFKYISQRENPNGSSDRIAGILNNERNVLGMMPHPERAAESLLGSNDGLNIFKSILLGLS